MAKRSSGHRPFSVLKDMVDRGEVRLSPDTDKRIEAPRKISSSLSDEEAFRQGMQDVHPLGWSATPLSLPAPFEIRKPTEDESEALEQLRQFVEGRGEIDPFAVGEGVEGASSREGRNYLERLKNGEFSVQAHLDLHGLGPAEARGALERFVKASQHKGHFCVRIVHGRGVHSREEPAILKRQVARWLASRKMSRSVVAFASARWRDGGGGALYVLLYGKWRPARSTRA